MARTNSNSNKAPNKVTTGGGKGSVTSGIDSGNVGAVGDYRDIEIEQPGKEQNQKPIDNGKQEQQGLSAAEIAEMQRQAKEASDTAKRKADDEARAKREMEEAKKLQTQASRPAARLNVPKLDIDKMMEDHYDRTKIDRSDLSGIDPNRSVSTESNIDTNSVFVDDSPNSLPVTDEQANARPVVKPPDASKIPADAAIPIVVNGKTQKPVAPTLQPIPTAATPVDISEHDGIVYDRNSGAAGNNVAEVLDQTQENYVSNASPGEIGQDIIDDLTPEEVEEVENRDYQAARDAESIPVDDVADFAREAEFQERGADNTEPDEDSNQPDDQSSSDKKDSSDVDTDTRDNSKTTNFFSWDKDVEAEPYDSIRERNERNRIHRANIIDSFSEIFSIEGQEVRDDGSTRLPKNCQRQLLYFMDTFKATDADIPEIFSAVRKVLGITPDKSNKYFKPNDDPKNQGMDKLELTEDEFLYALRMLENNCKVAGHPFIITDVNKKIHGTTVIPIPFMSPQEFALFSREGTPYSLHANNRDISWTKANQRAMDEWQRNIHPRIKHSSTNTSQRVVLEAAARACLEAYPTVYSLEDADILDDMAVPISEAVDVIDRMLEDGSITHEDLKAAQKAVAEREKKALKALQKTKPRSKRNADGSMRDVEQIRENPGEAALNMIVAGLRLSGVALDLPLMGANVLERIDGQLTHYAASQAMFLGKNNKKFKPTKRSHDIMRGQYDTLKAYGRIASSGGQNMLFAFSQTGMLPTEENIAEFKKKNIGVKQESDSKVINGMQKATAKATDIVGDIMSMDWIMRGSDCDRFLDNFMNRQAENARNGLPYYTPEQVENALRLNPERFVAEAMATMDGQRAFAQMRQRTLGGNTLLSEPLASVLRNHKLVDATIAILINKYAVFGVKASEKCIPFLNSIELLAMKTVAKAKGVELDSLKYSELLTSREFKDSLLLDIVQLPSRIGKLSILLALMGVLEFAPPDDEDNNKYKWDEYKIGGVPIRMMWYLDDFFNWTAPLAVAIKVNETTGDMGTAVRVFFDGMHDILGGLSIADAIDTILNFDQAYVRAQMSHDSDEGKDIEFDNFEFYTTMLMVTGLDVLTQLTMPRAIRNQLTAGIDTTTLDHSYTTVWADEEHTRVKATSFRDAQIRRISQKNPVIAFIMNAGRIFSGEGDPNDVWTGYGYEEMPLRTISDPCGMYTKYARFGTERSEGMTDEEYEDDIKAKVDDLLKNVIDEFDNAEEIAGMGIVLGSGIRKYATEAIQQQIEDVWKEYYEKLATPGLWSDNGLSWTENKALQNEAYNEVINKQKALEAKSDLINSKKIPSEVPKYAMWRTDWQEVFTNKDGSEATAFDYIISQAMNKFGFIPNEEVINFEMRPYGNIRQPLAFGATSVVDRDTYDYLTPLEWWSSSWSNWDDIKEFYKDATVNIGTFEGQEILDVITQGGEIFDSGGEWKEVPVLGRRAYVAIGDSYNIPEEDQAKIDWDAVNKVKEDGKNSSSSSSKYPSSYGYGKRYSSSGGSSYNPKIYSNPHSVSADKAQGMSVRQPYGATKSYLRPDFETKGSREAYKRSDI